MKILHVLAQLPMKTGSGVYFSNVVAGLENYDVEQAAIYASTADYNINITNNDYQVVFESEEVPFPIAGMSNVMPYKNTLYKEMTAQMLEIWSAAFRKRLEKAKEQFKPDVVITHHLWILSSLVCEIFADTKVIGVCHNTDIRQAQKNPHIAEKYVKNLGKLEKVLALSSSQIDEIAETFTYKKENIVDMGAGYNDKVFYPAENYPKKEKIELLYAGKFDESKGFYELIKAFKILEKKYSDITLDLIGAVKDSDIERVEKLAEHSRNIRIYNTVSQQKLGSIMRTKDIFILPSYFEGLGLIAVEALGSGLRVVATEIVGLMELLGEKINNSEVIEYVQMPTIYDTDKAVEEEKPAFVNRLAQKVEIMIERTREQRAISQNIMEEIESHSWKAKIEEIYKLL